MREIPGFVLVEEKEDKPGDSFIMISFSSANFFHSILQTNTRIGFLMRFLTPRTFKVEASPI